MTLELRVIQTLGRNQQTHPQPHGDQDSLRDVDGGMEGRFRGFLLLDGGVDGRQGGLRTRHLAGGSGLLAFVAHGEVEVASLLGQKALEIKRMRPE